MIETSGLTYSYSGGKPLPFGNMMIQRGQHWLLLGESGSGKTTLLHLIGGLLKAQKGKIEIAGTDITALSESQLDKFRGRHFGFIFQKNHLIQALSVSQNLLMAPFLAGIAQQESRVDEVLNHLGLLEKKHARINELSYGQAQRVAIARAVLNKPEIILADEPTSALDDKNCDRVIDLLLTMAEETNSTLIVATHDQRLKSKIANQLHLQS